MSNYWKRVRELAAWHSDPPDLSIREALLNADSASLFSGQHTDAAGLEALSKRIPTRIEHAGRALSVLSGDGVPKPEDITIVEEVAGDVAELIGQIAMLDNRIDQEIDPRRNQGSCGGARSAQAKPPQGIQGAAEAEPHHRRNGRRHRRESRGWKQN